MLCTCLTAGQHLKAGHPESLQHLDFCKQTPRPTVPPQTLAEQEEEEELDKAPDDARLEQQRSPLMSATIQHNTNRCTLYSGRCCLTSCPEFLDLACSITGA